jgi:hypothetical protein
VSWQSIPVFDSPRQEAVFVLFVVGQIRRKNKRLIVFHKAVNQNSPVEIPNYVTQSTYSGTRSHSKAFIEIRDITGK